jgi:hypothetical protein
VQVNPWCLSHRYSQVQVQVPNFQPVGTLSPVPVVSQVCTGIFEFYIIASSFIPKFTFDKVQTSVDSVSNLLSLQTPLFPTQPRFPFSFPVHFSLFLRIFCLKRNSVMFLLHFLGKDVCLHGDSGENLQVSGIVLIPAGL